MCHAIFHNLNSLIILASILLYGCIDDSKFQSGINTAYMDTTVSPGDNFMNYANGSWLKNTEIPKDRPTYGIGYMVDDEINDRIKEIIESSAAGDFADGTDEQIVGDYYRSYMDIETRNNKGMAPLQEDIARIDAISNYDDLVAYFAYANKLEIETPLQLHIWPDLHDATRNNVYVQQSGLGLPEKEYYFNSDDHSVHLRNKYLEFMRSSLRLLEVADADSAAEAIFSIEKQLAQNHMNKEESGNYTNLYNVYEVEALKNLMPDFNWTGYLDEAGLNDRDSIVIEMVDYTKSLNDFVPTIALKDWKTYLKWSLFRNMASSLSESTDHLYFNYVKELFGLESKTPLWRRGIRNINDDLGQLVVKLYGKNYVSEEAISEVSEMIENIKQAFRESITESGWMQEETKQEMLKKLNNLTAAVVYQKKWKDYSNLRIEKDDYFGNRKRYLLNEYRITLDKLNKPIEKDETEVQINSGSYISSLNMFLIGAAFLMPPYYDFNNDDAANYGGVGTVIGHEIGHGFDRIGSEFDSNGNARDWWTQKDGSEFKALSDPLIQQFNQYEVLDDLYINGEYTLNENLADLTGISIALRAYKNVSSTNGDSPILDGYNGIQRFFIASAQAGMYKSREEYLKRQVAIDNHSPPQFRVNGIVKNVDEFYEAFNVKPDDSLFLEPANRVKLW